jgi:tetratricopeptide (TPR) repeat protein
MSSAVPTPDGARTRYVAGLTQLSSGQAEKAVGTLRDILSLYPSHAGIRRNLIRALAAVRDHAAIVAETAHALRDAPDSAELHFLRGTACNALFRPLEARDALTAAVRLNPTFAPGWLNLGNALMDLDDLTAAEAHCRHALGLDAGLVEAQISLGFILTSQGRLAEAIGLLEAAIESHPHNVHAHWNLAAATLLSGDLPRGFAEYEWRKRHDRFRRDFVNLPGPLWDGGDPRGCTILIRAEQGLGDTVQFARYLAEIVQRGGKPVLACEPSLIPLLQSIAGSEVISKRDRLPRYDAWIDQMSLPHVFGTTLGTIPSPAGYLTADPALIAAHRASLPAGRCIGLAFAGNPMHRNDHRRTPPAAALAPLATLPDSHVVSLVPDRLLPGIAAPARTLTDYAETAALIAALDLVITVDTSVAHVAGALGKPTWVLLPYAPDWRWLLQRNDTPWYDSVSLFRQSSPGDWQSVIAAVVAALARDHRLGGNDGRHGA